MEQNKIKTGFGLIGILIVVAVIAVVSGGGLYFNEQKKQQSLLKTGNEAINKAKELKERIEGKTYPSTGSTSSQQASSGQAAIDTSDWKVYRNEKYGFGVRYPVKYQEVNNSIRSDSVYIDFDFTVRIIQFGQSRPIILDNLQAWELPVSNAGEGFVYWVFVKKPSREEFIHIKFRIDSLDWKNNRAGLMQEINQILSTFKFAELVKIVLDKKAYSISDQLNITVLNNSKWVIEYNFFSPTIGGSNWWTIEKFDERTGLWDRLFRCRLRLLEIIPPEKLKPGGSLTATVPVTKITYKKSCTDPTAESYTPGVYRIIFNTDSILYYSATFGLR